ncbi:Hemin transport protein [Pseudoxanthomonas jiangsuensis]|uniref:Hemin transport protein n=1 Tax=Pseudoxanthomonas jiangsuensis TaxID=619688 RepID=UPI001390EB53|nr:Hemin transport protein [Pseudoxanthomonas jiangsuensis]KAF1698746.1 Hemin transport protein [Pseudoxanthomonas jiangsuensis]
MASQRSLHAIAAAPRRDRLLLPRARQLAELGTVLCMYRVQQGGELAGWMQAVRAQSQVGVDSDGMCESLRFFDGRGQCCWRLFLLPDSDFLAWDTLAAQLPPCDGDAAGQGGVAERLWRRVAGRLGGAGWRVCALRLHVLPREGAAALAASPAPVSALGAAAARRIARQEGAEGEVRLDDCCCARAAAASIGFSPAGGSEVPLVRL